MLRDQKFVTKPVNDTPHGQKRKTTQTCSSEARLRLACNRCHAQKLRCLRSEGTEPGNKCDRCRRASVLCVYSPPNRIGRPARTGKTPTTSSADSLKSDGQSSLRNASQQHSPKSPSPGPQPRFPPRQGSSIDSMTEDSGMFDFHWDGSDIKVDMVSYYNNDMPSLESSIALFTENTSILEEISRNTYMSEEISGIPSSTDRSCGAPGNQLFATEKSRDSYVRELTTLGLTQYDQLRHLERMRNYAGDNRKALFTRLHGYPIHDMLEQVQKLTEIIRQLMPVPEYGSGLFGVSPDAVSEPIPELDSSLFTDNTMANEFSDILVQPFSDISCLSSGGSSSRLSPITPSKPAPIDTSTILLFVSCYLRLAQSFALFFTDLHAFLVFPSVIDPIPSDMTRLFPGLKLGSFQSYVGVGLEISIVVQVSERMLHRLHSSLGLSWGQCDSENSFSHHFPTGTWNNAEAITPVMIRAIQAQERIEARDERGDTFTRLLLIIEGVKKLMKSQPLL
ncbi:hypothetical protein MferCBS31731_000964 [Microsporum ferrugineum]